MRIRHTLSPDNASITFASKGDLTNHWLCAITLEIERDWTWDAIQDLSLRITREKRFREDKPEEAETGEIGDVEIKKTAPFNALINPQRNGTTVIFIDAVETKNLLKQPPGEMEPRFPDLIELTYTVQAQFEASGRAQRQGPETKRWSFPSRCRQRRSRRSSPPESPSLPTCETRKNHPPRPGDDSSGSSSTSP